MILPLVKSVLSHYRLRRDPIAFAQSLGVTIGKDCDIVKPDMAMFGSEPYLITIGDRVTISYEAIFVNHDGGVRIFRNEYPELDVVGKIVVGNNVFIGMRAIILGGITIGNNCVIGAGSVVTRDVPSGFVVAGVPARPIKTIEEYWEGLSLRAVPTKRLSSEQKRLYFNRNDITTKHRHKDSVTV